MAQNMNRFCAYVHATNFHGAKETLFYAATKQFPICYQ